MRNTLIAATTILIATTANAAQYEIDKSHSSLMFRVNHLGAAYVYGMIPDIQGNVQFDPQNPQASNIQVTINPESLNTFEPRRDTHLKSPDFFNTRQFPTITFKSTIWKKTGDSTYEITGDLTLLGTTKSITIQANHIGYAKNRQGQDLTGFETTFTIDRTDFGMNYGVADTGGLGKDVTIMFAIELVKQS